MTTIWISNDTTEEMLYAFSCGWQRWVHLLLLHTLFLQRTQLVWRWLSQWRSGMFYCSMLCSLCWIRNKSWASQSRLLFPARCDSPASSLCSCGAWNPSRLSWWLHCVCGNNCLDLQGIRKCSVIDIQKWNIWFYLLWYRRRGMISHTRCVQTINVEHLLSSSTSSYITKNIFSVAYSGVYPSR